ncbi:stringent starvation protein B domain protein [Wolbachia endosymbiont of Atemnus politus]|uniref:ClpXP protease specificity-enhancing factor SspB n=1 Tax=Wolbachia endosymbiont of Atemnus politus TaxID=2682840 RepID=UPI001572B062|nr:ClpXP protease specificity-enhancing factor SspB [Wolbachia endosymbiont of Atemnus politus]NSM56632.1 stringent starvation protein B domain protein [Wolbachia endosymbiont of Atemnus politus]NSX83795.1 stringent starvation protein B domain protein [Wolbachia endosymbiont of Atemnus politus]
MDNIGYKKSLNSIKFQVIRKALDIASGDSFTPHLEILFFTGFNGVIVPDYLKKSYPTQMLIILQHQFYDLKVFEDEFSVSLSFHGKREQITVPFFAISEFHDKISGDVLIFSIDSEKEYKSEKCTKKSPNGSIISIDQLRGE